MSNGKSSLDPSNQALAESTRVDSNHYPQSKLDLSRVLKLRLVNKLTYPEIAKQFGCSKQAIHKALGRVAHLMDRPEALDAYQDHKDNILAAAQLEVIDNLVDPVRLKKASVNNLAYAAQSLDNMIRLQRGETTSNIGYADYSKALEQVIKDRAKLEAELGIYNATDSGSE